MQNNFLENTIWEVIDSFVLSGRFKNPFVTFISLSELYFSFRRFILLVKTKKVISMNYDSSTSF